MIDERLKMWKQDDWGAVVSKEVELSSDNFRFMVVSYYNKG